tara:strand:+ start:257 stop:454 length:198 start_codon:yes stop_codon:yes gene_type:complete
MEIGKEYFAPIPTTTSILTKALQEIKEVIQQDPSREIVGAQTLTLVNIYDIIERAEKELNLKHQN